MKLIGLLLLLSVVLSCNKANITNEEVISEIQNSNYKLFYMVTTEARYKMDGVFKAPSLTKEFNGVDYFLPNFLYYGCFEPEKKCLEDATNKQFGILEFSKKNNIEDEKEAYAFVNNYTSEIFNEFEKLSVYRILSRSLIGECIIFYIDENNYVAYVPNVEKIHNELWKSRFVPENKIDKHWYTGNR